jgi:hypothetical protein
MNIPISRDIAPEGTAALADPGFAVHGQVHAFWKYSMAEYDNLCKAGALRTDSEGNAPERYDAADVLRDGMNAGEFSKLAGNGQYSRVFNERVEGFRADSAIRTDSEEYEGIDFRADSATAGGSVLARQLEAQWARVLEMKSPKLLGLSIFPVNTDAAPGAENMRITRFLERGQAQIYNGGSAPIPSTSLRQVSDHIYFRHIVSGAQWTIFDQLAWNFARLDGVSRSLNVARKAVEQLHDQIIWLGSPGHGVYGVTTFPWLNRRIVQTTFSSSADKDAMIAEIVNLVNYPAEKSNGTFVPGKIAMAQKLVKFLTGTRLGTPNDSSLMTFIKKALDEIYQANSNDPNGQVQIISVPRLNDIGGTNVHGVFVFTDDPDAISVVVSQPTTMLPLFQSGANFQQVVYKTMAGVTMPNVGANIMGYVTSSGF